MTDAANAASVLEEKSKVIAHLTLTLELCWKLGDGVKRAA
jgi:hypothetical protein